MRSSRTMGVVALATVGCMLLLPAAGVATASGKPGMTKASAAVARAIVADTAEGVQAKCQNVKVTKSSKSWGAFGPKSPPPRGCPAPGDYFAVVKKERGTWRIVPVANNASCEEIANELKSAGASKSVMTDFLKGYFIC